MSLNLHLLRLFAAVARHRSFSRAAEALHLSQPAVSKGVRDFEAQIGNP
jgi:DNA-binding transcriptional LysR family regulator